MEHGLQVNEICVVVWTINENLSWYVGYVKSIWCENLEVEHWERTHDRFHDFWKYPMRDDLQTVLQGFRYVGG